MKKLLYIAIMLFSVSFVISGCAKETPESEIDTDSYNALLPSPSEDFYVNDYANVLDEDTKQLILKESSELAGTIFKPQVVVLTVESLEGMEIEAYARQIGKKWSIGGKNMKWGILILYAADENKQYVDLGTGIFRSIDLEGFSSGSLSGTYLYVKVSASEIHTRFSMTCFILGVVAIILCVVTLSGINKLRRYRRGLPTDYQSDLTKTPEQILLGTQDDRPRF